MPKIAVIISRNEYVRNYLDSGAFQEVLSDNEVTLFLSPQLSITPAQKVGFSGVNFLPNLAKPNTGQLIFDLYMIRYRNRSSSFRYRIKRIFPPIYWQLNYLIKHRKSAFASNKIPTSVQGHEFSFSSRIKKRLKRMNSRKILVFLQLLIALLKGKSKKLLYFGLGSKFLFRQSIRILRHKTRRDLESLDIFRDYSAVIIPSSAYEYHSSLIILNAKNTNTKTILLVDNWDNLSSKSILWEKPDVVACWGEQSKEHAVEIQKMPKHSVIPIGTPRIDPYFGLRQNEMQSKFNFRYILFLGSSVPYDEAGFLKKLDFEVSSNPEIYQNVKIIYRPHPLRGGWEAADISNLSLTILDPDLEEAYLSGAIRWSTNTKLPPLDNYAPLLANSEMVVSGLTSMIFEASIFGKYCCGLAFDEKWNLTNPKRLLEEYLHFHGIENLPNLDLFSEQDIALEKIRHFFLFGKKLDQKEIDDNLQFFLYHNDTSYAVRLRNLLETAISM